MATHLKHGPNSEENELINMPKVVLKPEGVPPMSIALVISLTPLVNGLVMMWWVGCHVEHGWPLVFWHVWAWLAAVDPQPITTLRGAVWSFLMIVGGVYVTRQFGHTLIRTQYVMATIMFAWARGKSRYFHSEDEYHGGIKQLKRDFLFSIGGILGTILVIAGCHYVSKNYSKEGTLLYLCLEAIKVFAGGLNFMFGIYLGGAIYTVPIYTLCKSPTTTLKPQPLMIAPWKSETFKEFWSARWDTGMQSVLYNNAYRPVRKFGGSRGLAMLATFVFSGLIHCPLIHELGGSTRDLGLTFSFFIVQAIYVALEDTLKPPPSQFRTLFLVYLSSPLFVYPVLRRMGFSD